MPIAWSAATSTFDGFYNPERLHSTIGLVSPVEFEFTALLSLVLVGLPELDQRLRLSCNRSLWSRIHTRVHVGEANPEDGTSINASSVPVGPRQRPLRQRRPRHPPRGHRGSDVVT